MIFSQEFSRATQLLRQGSIEDAGRIVAGILARDPRNVEALSLMSIVHIQAQDPETAVDLLSRACTIDPSHPGVLLNLAGALRMTGRLPQAIACLERATALKPGARPAALSMMAQIHLQSGNLGAVIATCNTILAADKHNTGALNLRAIANLEQGKTSEALQDFDEILRQGQASPMIIGQKATALSRADRRSEALALLDRTLVAQPREASLHRTKARILLEMGEAAGAIASCDQALALTGPEPLALLVKGDAHMLRHDLASALQSFRQAQAMAPTSSDICIALGSAMVAAGQYAEALQLLASPQAQDPRSHLLRAAALEGLSRFIEARSELDAALRASPNDTQALSRRLEVNRHLGSFRQALADCEHLRQLVPESSTLWNTRGNLLRQLGRHDEAIESLVNAFRTDNRNWLALQSLGCLNAQRGHASTALDWIASNKSMFQTEQDFYLTKGNILLDLRHVDEAITAFDGAVSAADTPVAHYYRALALLTAGRLHAGFAAYEWRRRGDQPILKIETYGLPEPRTVADLAGKHLLLQAEQGLGDVLQFARFAMRLLNHAASVSIMAHGPLKDLLSTLHPDIAVHTFADRITADLVLPLMSLPWFLGIRNHDDLAQAPYLHADEGLRTRWRSALGPRTKPRIGLCWSGNPLHANDAMRSIPIATLAPLASIPGVEVVSLQPEVRETDEIPLADAGIIDYRDVLTDFAQTAALVSELDLVVTIDTSIAHLAGALGIPTWILLPSNADWRWMEGTSRSPWYAQSTLFRQPSPGAWVPVRDEVAARLKRFAS